jgi:hypothetical protein
MIVFPTEDDIVTVTTLAVLLLPQPLRESRQTAASKTPRKLDFLHTFVPTISPTQSRDADLPVALAFLTFTKILCSTSVKERIAAVLKMSG